MDVPGTSTSRLISHLLSTNSLSKASPTLLLQALGLETTSDDAQVRLTREDATSKLTGGVAVSNFEFESYVKYVKACRLVSRELQLTPGQQGLIVNGRVSTIFS
jgi:UDP-glucose:glycoprotein glucosyltransferase